MNFPGFSLGKAAVCHQRGPQRTPLPGERSAEVNKLVKIDQKSGALRTIGSRMRRPFETSSARLLMQQAHEALMNRELDA